MTGIDLTAVEVQDQTAAILVAAGTRPEDAEVVAADLVLADQMGVHSHGVMRVPEYVAAAADGRVDVAGRPAVVRDLPAGALVDGGRSFGQCAGRFALGVAAAKAVGTGSAVVVVRNSHHLGRIGVLGEIGAARGLLVLAFVAVGTPGPVAPFGGSEGRLGTNPIAYGVPAGSKAVVADFATAAWPEGAVNLARRLGHDVPPGVLIDAAGQPTTAPEALYAEPPGAILPFGGAWAHRGSALNLMVELFAGTLAGYGPRDADRPSNCLFLLAVDPAAYALGERGYAARAGETVAFVKSARPGPAGDVLMPGERETAARAAAGERVVLAAATVEALDEAAAVAGLAGRLGH
jgi:LDH2 family malate/lactate/ureidoglycolate dehydrogenase